MVLARLNQFPAVALVGPRQVGKTTLAHAIGDIRPTTYLDLQLPADRAKLADAASYLTSQKDKLVILDEIQLVPELFQTLRGLIDQGRREGLRSGRFLILGSASEKLQRQSESLAGRIAHLELRPLDVLEVEAAERDSLWLRGGFPDSFRALSDSESFVWRESLIRTYLERDIPFFAPRMPAETLRRFWTMLAHNHAGLLNASALGRGLETDHKAIGRYLDLLVDLFLVRRLQPFYVNVGKRLTKSPKIYIRDSGLVHALLNIETFDHLLGHPIVGASWEGFAIETLIAANSPNSRPSFYRTQAGSEMDLILERPGGRLWAMEIKRGIVPTPTKGFYSAIADLKPERTFVVHAGTDRFPMKDGVEAIGLRELAAALAAEKK